MDFIDRLAEQRIAEALERGDLDDLPGAGKPLALDDDSMVPAHLRTAYRILKNANCIPPELAQQQEVRELEDLIDALYADATAEAVEVRTQAERRLALLRARLERSGCGEGTLSARERAYHDRLLRRLSD
ncbi:MAG: DnaJ family domain-containing protein [Halorhodospira sp.]